MSATEPPALPLDGYVSVRGEVRVVTERVDEHGVRHICDVIDPSRCATWDKARKQWIKREWVKSWPNNRCTR